MPASKYTGSGSVASADFRYIKYVGKSKAGKTVTIEMSCAYCTSNPDWTFSEKDDTIASITFEGCYDDTNLATGDRTEPWTIEIEDGQTAGNSEILSGVGRFYVGTNASDAALVGLTRGGGQFTVEREYREINADNDPGAVKDRVVQEGGRPKLTMNLLQWLTKIPTVYAGMKNA